MHRITKSVLHKAAAIVINQARTQRLLPEEIDNLKPWTGDTSHASLGRAEFLTCTWTEILTWFGREDRYDCWRQ